MSGLPSAEDRLRSDVQKLLSLPLTEQADERNRLLVFYDGSLFPPGTVDERIREAERETARGNGRGAPRPVLPIHTVPELVAMKIPRPEYVIAPPFALARGTVAELDAYPKHGKTRLALDAVWSLLHDLPFLDAPTVACKVLYLTEEWLVTWRDALEGAHLLGEQAAGLHWMSLIDLRDRKPGDWSGLCESVCRFCLGAGIGLLVVDTLARWAGVADENDPQAMAAAVLPLRLIAAEGIAVLFLRHDRKGGGLVGESGRGSSATSGVKVGPNGEHWSAEKVNTGALS